MGSPSFAKPTFVSAIAVMIDSDVSEERISDIREANDLTFDEYDDDYVSDDYVMQMIAETDEEDACLRANDVESTLEEIKRLVDSELESLKPEVDFSCSPWVSDWFEIERIAAYNGDGIGFELAFGYYTPCPYANTDTLASVFWEEADKEQAEQNNVSYEQVDAFFEIVEAAYDYMMLAVGYNEYIDEINGGWCGNTSYIAEAPTPATCLEGTRIIEVIKENLERFALAV